MHQTRIRLECLKLAVEMCKTAGAFDRPERVMELTKQFESYCCHGESSALELGAAVRAAGLTGDPPPDPPARKLGKREMAKLLA